MKLFPHQKEITNWIGNLGLFWDTGTGKTLAALAWCENKKTKYILILCPASIMKQWESECEKYFKTKKIKLIKDKERNYSDADIYVVSYETFKRDYRSKVDVSFLNNCCLIADEASKFKNNKTSIYKMMKYISTRVKHKIILTATPLETQAMNIYNICSIINNNWCDWYTYVNRYVEWEEVWNGKETIRIPGKTKNHEELRNRLKTISHRITKEEVRKDLPPLTIQWREVEASKEQKRIKKELLGRSENFFEIATLLKSLDNGVNELLESDSDRVKDICITPEVSNKIKILYEILGEINDKTLIFTQFKRSAEIIYTELENKYNCEITYGGDSEKENKIKKLKEGEIQILITTDTLAYGLSLDEVDYVINYDLPYNPAKLHQRTQRIHRITSSRGKTSINLIGGVIDCDVYEILKERDAEFQYIINGIGESLGDTKMLQKIAEKYGKSP